MSAAVPCSRALIAALQAESGRIARLLEKLSPQRVLHAATSVAFLREPNDIAVSTKSAQAVPGQRVPAAQMAEVTCDHLTFFSSNAGPQAVLEALRRA